MALFGNVSDGHSPVAIPGIRCLLVKGCGEWRLLLAEPGAPYLRVGVAVSLVSLSD
jgi:hypothetical protein